ncbi:MAG: GNAT family N-acetyltransferase [Candidatus Zipacnadales bacterium]
MNTDALDITVRRCCSWLHGDILVVEAYLDGTRISGARVMRPYRKQLGDDSWWIMDLHTRRPFRRMGFGRRIVEECLAAANKRGIPVLFAGVDERNEPSRRLFESVGFIRVADPTLEQVVSWAHTVLLFWPPRVVVYVRRTETNPV